jgi:very-short-patch-repair endonuclease
MIPYHQNLKPLSRELRKNMTDAEKLLWLRIQRKQLQGKTFYRQKALGNYIVDFYCPSSKLIIEVDGGQHFTNSGMLEDQRRDAYFREIGIRVKRYSDREVLTQLNEVLEVIYRLL